MNGTTRARALSMVTPPPGPVGVVRPLAHAQGVALGRAAFLRGLRRYPAADPGVQAAVANVGRLGLPFGSSTPLLDGWLLGWDTANLSAPVPT